MALPLLMPGSDDEDVCGREAERHYRAATHKADIPLEDSMWQSPRRMVVGNHRFTPYVDMGIECLLHLRPRR